MKKIIITIICFVCVLTISRAEPLPVQMFQNRYRIELQGGDTIYTYILPPVTIFPPMFFKNRKQEQYYWKMVRDVKITLPYAKLIHGILIETYEYIETLPTKKEREAHLSRMEKEVFKEYKPILKKMSFSQGKLLIRLIDRECNQSSYQLIRAFLGDFRAGFWQTFGALFGASLKAEWDPKGKDAMLERICVLVEQGLL